MILEMAVLCVRPGQEAEFETGGGKGVRNHCLS